jgi:uncharacterized protein (TIGR03083 family)
MLSEGLLDDEWTRPTGCPGWTVHDVVAHVVDLETRLRDGGVVEVGATEEGVAERRSLSPDALVGALESAIGARLAQLAPLTERDLETPSATPIGTVTLRDALAMRTMDVWVHEQDIRRALGRPGHDRGPVVSAAVDYLAQFLGLVVARRAEAPDGASVQFEVGDDSFGVAVMDRRGSLVAAAPNATVTLTMSAPAFAAFVGGRTDASVDEVDIVGDERLGRRVLDSLGFLP